MYSRCKNFASNYGKKMIIFSGLIVPTAAFFMVSSNVVAGDMIKAHPAHYHFDYERWFHSFDTAALRRGFQVYKEVCSSCHSLKYMYYRHLVGVIFTEKQAKKECATITVVDGPDDKGEMFERPAKLADKFAKPYKNDNAAKAANNGALPPDLTLMAGAREGGPSYIFSLLTGYAEEIPPGVTLTETQYFNPFMEGGILAMPPPLNDGAVEYPDGTSATVTQMARDVSEFLGWTYWTHMERQKQCGLHIILFSLTSAVFFYHARRYSIASYATQRITYVRPLGLQ